MKTIFIVSIQLLLSYFAYSQDLTFTNLSPVHIKEGKDDKPFSFPFKLEKAKADCKITIEIDEGKSSATKDKDYSLTSTSPIELTTANKFSGKIDIVIKADDFVESTEELHLKFNYTDEDKKAREVEYIIFIADLNDGSIDEPIYTDSEKNMLRNLSLEVFTGGNFDSFDGIKFQKLGGEFVTTANDIAGGPTKRFGGFLGISNFQNFTFDSSNRNVRVQHIRIDTAAYINGKTKYITRTFVDHTKLSTNQWSYYVNPTFRLNRTKSDLFNIYLSLRAEVLRIETKTEFQSDTISRGDTTTAPLGNLPVFQSGKGFLLQKVTDIETNGFFSIGTPMFLNAKDKFKLYFDPNIGVTLYSYSAYQPSQDRKTLNKVYYNVAQMFYLFRLRVTEQFSGLNITVGGEIRGILPNYTPTINAYLGIRANIEKWFSKNKGVQ